jgi:hypothetical protein
MTLSPWQMPAELSEAEIAAQQAGVRAQLIARLERLWMYCLDNIGGSEDEKADPRFAELAVRITDRIAKLYRLDRPPVEVPDDVDEVSDAAATRALVTAQLDALAARRQS